LQQADDQLHNISVKINALHKIYEKRHDASEEDKAIIDSLHEGIFKNFINFKKIISSTSLSMHLSVLKAFLRRYKTYSPESNQSESILDKQQQMMKISKEQYQKLVSLWLDEISIGDITNCLERCSANKLYEKSAAPFLFV
jgi:hypothetical protein